MKVWTPTACWPLISGFVRQLCIVLTDLPYLYNLIITNLHSLQLAVLPPGTETIRKPWYKYIDQSFIFRPFHFALYHVYIVVYSFKGWHSILPLPPGLVILSDWLNRINWGIKINGNHQYMFIGVL